MADFSFTEPNNVFHFIVIQSIRKDNGFGSRVNALLFVMVNGHLGKSNRVATVVPYPVKELGQFLIELSKENFCRIRVGKSDSQVASVHIRPMFQSEQVSHLVA